MIRKFLPIVALAAAIPIAASNSASAVKCQTWNAWSPPQHHKVGKLDIVGGHGYGSGYHSSTYQSPPQPMGAYGDPKRRAAQGGYIQYVNGPLIVHVNLFGPLDENDTTHLYDTSYGVCVSYGDTRVNSGQKCLATSRYKKPNASWVPCGGY
jgi:hypothetical protein